MTEVLIFGVALAIIEGVIYFLRNKTSSVFLSRLGIIVVIVAGFICTFIGLTFFRDYIFFPVCYVISYLINLIGTVALILFFIGLIPMLLYIGVSILLEGKMDLSKANRKVLSIIIAIFLGFPLDCYVYSLLQNKNSKTSIFPEWQFEKEYYEFLNPDEFDED